VGCAEGFRVEPEVDAPAALGLTANDEQIKFRCPSLRIDLDPVILVAWATLCTEIAKEGRGKPVVEIADDETHPRVMHHVRGMRFHSLWPVLDQDLPVNPASRDHLGWHQVDRSLRENLRDGANLACVRRAQGTLESHRRKVSLISID
jgi:hypothetical protein